MRPREFIARIIDLFDFDLSPSWPNADPPDLSAAALYAAMAVKTPGFDDLRKVVNSYLFVIEVANELGLSTIRATMIPTEGHRPLVQPLLEGLRATICFAHEEVRTGFLKEAEDDDPMLETWLLPPRFEDRSEELTGMLTYLILKSNYRLRRIRAPH